MSFKFTFGIARATVRRTAHARGNFMYVSASRAASVKSEKAETAERKGEG
jgi:hypothetical protein